MSLFRHLGPRPIRHGQRARLIVILATALLAAGCASYRTPGRGISLASLSNADEEIKERMLREPSAPFPARVAVVRVQAPDYRTYSASGYGEGNYSVVAVRDIERPADFERIAGLPMVAALAPVSRLLLPGVLRTDKELRIAAAGLKCDLLLAYTIDTVFWLDEKDLGPLRLITLGMAPTQIARIQTTASAAFFDVRTGFVYGVAEASAEDRQIASAWTGHDVVEQSRHRAERQAFQSLLPELEKTWKGIVEEHAATGGAARAAPMQLAAPTITSTPH